MPLRSPGSCVPTDKLTRDVVYFSTKLYIPGQLASMSGSEMGTDVGVVGLDRAVAAAVAAAVVAGGAGGVRFLVSDLMMSGDESVVRFEMGVPPLADTGATAGSWLLLLPAAG